jgi:hypothetical protein
MVHKGIAASIASRYCRNNIDIIYSLEDAKSGFTPSYQASLIEDEFEYSYNLMYQLNGNYDKFEEIFNAVFDFIKESKELITKESIDINEIVLIVLSFGGLVGICFVKTIELTKDDYWPIRPFIIINDAELSGDDDLIEDNHLGEFDEPFIENKDSIQIQCSFCGHTVFDLAKRSKNWNEALKDSCEHFALAFATNAGNQLFGRNYYFKAFKRAVVDYVETYKGFTCQSNPEMFINDFLNGDTDLDEKDMASIIKILKSDMPDFDLQVKQFEKLINDRQHIFLFHFMKFL